MRESPVIEFFNGLLVRPDGVKTRPVAQGALPVIDMLRGSQ